LNWIKLKYIKENLPNSLMNMWISGSILYWVFKINAISSVTFFYLIYHIKCIHQKLQISTEQKQTKNNILQAIFRIVGIFVVIIRILLNYHCDHLTFKFDSFEWSSKNTKTFVPHNNIISSTKMPTILKIACNILFLVCFCSVDIYFCILCVCWTA
jgi:hypothetical protein